MCSETHSQAILETGYKVGRELIWDYQSRHQKFPIHPRIVSLALIRSKSDIKLRAIKRVRLKSDATCFETRIYDIRDLVQGKHGKSVFALSHYPEKTFLENYDEEALWVLDSRFFFSNKISDQLLEVFQSLHSAHE